jgi:catechol 2,3-dioxygenase-like lactoylglutathione lyase family enzyme
MKLTAARIFVKDLAAATSFYEGALGLRVGARGPEAGYVVFEAGGVDLVVEQVAPTSPQEEQALVGRFTGLSFSVTGIEAACAALQKRRCLLWYARTSALGRHACHTQGSILK